MKCSYEHNVPTTNINKDENAEKIELLENTVKVLQEHVKQLEEGQRAMHKRLEEVCVGSSKGVDTSNETCDSVK